MGEAKRRKRLEESPKLQRFLHLMKIISEYSDLEILKFASRRKKNLQGEVKA